MTFSIQTVRRLGVVDGIQRYTGLPLYPLGRYSSVRYPNFRALAGDPPLSSSIVRYGRLSIPAADGIHSENQFYTWIARMGGSLGGDPILNIVVKSNNGENEPAIQICNPDYVDWSSITRTGNIPRNTQGGRFRYTKFIGTVLVDDGSSVSPLGPAYEERQPIRIGNTLIEARKLAPIFDSSVYGSSTPDIDNFGWANILYVEILIDASSSFSTTIIHRRLSGIADETAYGRSEVLIYSTEPDPLNTIDIYIANVDPCTLTADKTTATLAGTIVPGTLDAFFITDAIYASASIPRWNQFILYAIPTVGLSGGTQIGAQYFSPIDIPPPYQCPGVDGMIPGGYYT